MPIAWSPPDRYLTRSRLRRFAAAHGHEDFGSLHRWSVEDQEGVWRAVDRDLGLVWRTPYRHVLDVSRGLPWTTWWLGGRMNYVESALRHDAARTAIIFEGEEGTTERLSYGELAVAEALCRSFLALEDDCGARGIVAERGLDIVHPSAEPPRRPGKPARNVEDVPLRRAPHESEVSVDGSPESVLIFDGPAMERSEVFMSVRRSEAAPPAARQIPVRRRPRDGHDRSLQGWV